MPETHQETAQERARKAAQLLATVQPEFLERWHWFGYHAQHPTPFMISIACACAELERIDPAAPERMLLELARIGGRERDRAHYHQLLQKMAEILAMRQVVLMPWPEGTRFEIEGAAEGSDKRCDVVVVLPDGSKVGFEVKAPDELKHAERRGQGGFQVPARGPDGLVGELRDAGENLILPRDNTIRDFLRSANEKFAAFKLACNFIGVLVIVWDDYIYEAIGPLTNERNGLLTNASFSRIGEEPETYPNIDGVIVLRHLTYFIEAAAERSLPDGRQDALHIGGDGALPNVLVPIPGGVLVPKLIMDGFCALPYDDPVIQRFAEYRANELIMWTRF